MAAVVGSRAGLYAYDVGYLELQQILVDERDRGACQGVEAALCGGNELLLSALTLLCFPDPADFVSLALLSALFVLLALALYSAWAALYHVHDHAHGGDAGDAHAHAHTPQQAKMLELNDDDDQGRETRKTAKRHAHVHYAGPTLTRHPKDDHAGPDQDHGHDHA